MGKTSKWFRNFLLGKKSEQSQTKIESNPPKEKKRWGFVRSSRSQHSPTRTRETSSFSSHEIEQNKRAIAVAAASAAAAEAAIAAAQAAAEVVRLTTGCSRLSPVWFSDGGGGKKNEIWAAVKIQAAFRGYLARRALRALKGLVKLQALVRGRIVRKQAAETLRCMQALVRAQSRARNARAMLSQRSPNTTGSTTPQRAKSSAHGSGVNRDKAAHKRCLSRQSGEEAMDMHGEDWLDQWMEERGRCSHQAPASSEEKIDKILEVDTQKPYFHIRRKGHYRTLGSKSISDTIGRSYTSMPDSPSKKSSTVQCSVSSLSSMKIHSPKSEIADEEVNSISSRPSARGSRREFFTPSRSDCSASVHSDFPNYMSNTQSSKAKVRSQSAPKQRPDYEKSTSASRDILQGSENSGSSRSGFAMKAYPGSGRLDRYGMPIREVDLGDRNRYY